MIRGSPKFNTATPQSARRADAGANPIKHLRPA
jgi:hypothetical protein